MSINTSAAGTASNSSVTILLGRILLAVIFLLSGFGKLSAISGTAAYFGGLGLPAPTATAVIVGLIELLGGLAVLVGFQTRIAAWVLAIFTIATGLVAH
ncbi:MAG: DoxX family protein, partial [Mesorhizobium sp.]